MTLLAQSQVLVQKLLSIRGVASNSVNVSGHALHFYHLAGQGSKTPVVLVHGLGGSANGFARMFHRLARNFRHVFAIDLPGNGFSPEPASGPLGLDEQLAVLEAFCEKEVASPAFVVGNSLGGAMSIELAARSPQLVKALGLLAPVGAKVAPSRIQELHEALNVQTTTQAFSLTRRLFHKTPWAFLPFASELRHLYSSPSVKKLLEDARESQRHHLEPVVLAGLKVPTLLIWGKSEKLLPYEGIDYFRSHLPPHAHIEEVEGFGHVPQMEHPIELADRLVSFAVDKDI